MGFFLFGEEKNPMGGSQPSPILSSFLPLPPFDHCYSAGAGGSFNLE
jgi:hypothetical protein